MTQELPPTTPIDGIASPAPLAQASPVAVTTDVTTPAIVTKSVTKKPASAHLVLIIFACLACAYIFPAFILIPMFPRQDGSLENIKLLGNMFYGIGAVLWMVSGFVALLRISTIKDNPKMRTIAFVRLLIGLVPVFLASAITLFLINAQPKFSLEILVPTLSEDLIAPVSVTFGMETALKVFRQQQLKPLKYEWDFTGDGKIDQQTFDPRATFIVRRSGIYAVTAIITMTSGEVKRASLRLLVPRESFGVEPSSPVIDEPVLFSLEHLLPKAAGDAKIPTLQKAKWDFDGDGVTDAESNKMTAATTYHRLGPTTVTVTMTLSNQTQSTLQRTIEVVKPQDQPFPITLETEPKTLLGPPPFGAVFTLKTKEPIASSTWDFGDQKLGEGLRIAHVFSSVGNFNVNVVARSQSGATAKLSRVVRVTNPLVIPDLVFQGKPDVKGFAIEGEVPLTVDITPVTSQPLISFSWDAQNASEVLATEKGFHAVYRDAGRYFLDIIGIDPDQNVFRKRIIVNAKSPKTNVSFTMDPPTPTAPATVTFDASDTFIPSGEEITGFEWDYGDGQKGNDETKFTGSRIDHLFQKPGTYIITLNIRTTSNQIYTGKQTLLVKAPIIDACFLPSRSSGTAPLGVRFDASCSTGDFTQWLWDFGDKSQSDQQNPSHVFLAEGEYKVVFSAQTKNGRKSTKTLTISVSAP